MNAALNVQWGGGVMRAIAHGILFGFGFGFGIAFANFLMAAVK